MADQSPTPDYFELDAKQRAYFKASKTRRIAVAYRAAQRHRQRIAWSVVLSSQRAC
jgi:hypothetical protein